MGDLVKDLREISALSACEESELEELGAICREMVVPEGYAFIVEGGGGDNLYFLLEGEVSIMDGMREMRRLQAPDLIGEIALIEKRPRTASCVTTTPARVYSIDRLQFDAWLEPRPLVYERIRVVASSRPGGR